MSLLNETENLINYTTENLEEYVFVYGKSLIILKEKIINTHSDIVKVNELKRYF